MMFPAMHELGFLFQMAVANSKAEPRSNMDIAKNFLQRAQDFRNIPSIRLLKNASKSLADVRSQCARLLFKAIDAGFLPDLWPPESRPLRIPARDANGKLRYEAVSSDLSEHIRDSLVSSTERAWKEQGITPTEEQKEYIDGLRTGKVNRPICLTDEELTPAQLGQMWWGAIARLYEYDNSAFPDMALFDDLTHVNDVFDAPDFTTPIENDDDRFDQVRRRATTYACACDLLSELVKPVQIAAPVPPSKPLADGREGFLPLNVEVPEQGRALTKHEQFVLTIMASFDASMLASVNQIIDAMPKGEMLSPGTVTRAIRKLLSLGLAERPEGIHQGARLTLRGRRSATRIVE